MTKGIFEEYTGQKAEIPFPQMDVHLDKGIELPFNLFSNVFPITSRYEGFYWSKSL
ncbi:MAG TPA: hypothetical protein VMW26_06155 [Methanomassiliicoccales archaeon]|nr:hypothetical protein [Methanomassiliicoccales archaeon]